MTFPQQAGQFLRRIGLLQEFEAVPSLLCEHMAVAGGENDRQARIEAADRLAELDAAHARMMTSVKTTSKPSDRERVWRASSPLVAQVVS